MYSIHRFTRSRQWKRASSLITGLLVVALIAACSVPDSTEPELPNVSFAERITESNTPASQPTATIPTSTQQQTIATLATTEAPTIASETAPPFNATAAPVTKGTITFAFDSLPTYFPGIIMKTSNLLQKRGYDLQLVPLGLNAQTTFSETTRYDKLRSGEWDVMAMTLDSFARQSDPQIGAITTLINERAGAEKLVVTPDIATVNDLQGKRVAININNTSHGFFLYYALNLAGLTTAQISLISYQTEAEAVQAYLNGAADAVIANEPEVLAAEQNKGTVLITSDTLRTTIDVLVTSRPALTTKTEAVQAFHDAWYEALQLVIDSPDEAGGMIVAWNQADWTSVTQPEGFATQLEKLAQATLGSNQLAFQQQGTLINRLQDAQRVWSVVGGQPAAQVDFAPMIDGQFVLATSKADRFFSSQSPVNDSFLLTSRVEVPGIAAQNTQATQSFVKLKLEQIPFDADSAQLSDQAIADLNEQVLPVLKASNLYLQIQGGSAWPGPRGRFSEEDIDQFARQRAVAVASFLTRQGIDPNRLLLLDILESQYPESLNESELAQDRRVRFVLVGGGR